MNYYYPVEELRTKGGFEFCIISTLRFSSIYPPASVYLLRLSSKCLHTKQYYYRLSDT
jgi:hypothetical protein